MKTTIDAAKHTPGPWKAHRNCGRTEIAPVDGSTGAQPIAAISMLIRDRGGRPASDANAALIAAAPDLLAALEPFAFGGAKNIRFIFTHNPEVLTCDGGDFAGQCVLVISGPWHSHMETPDMRQCVANARAAIAEAEVR